MIVISAVGDMMFSRDVRKSLDEMGNSVFFEKIKKCMPYSDISFGNLETSLADCGTPFPGKSPHVTFCGPPSVADGLSYVGFNILGVANNHTCDYGEVAFDETLDCLNTLKIFTCGASTDYNQKVSLFEIDGQKIGFLAFSMIFGPDVSFGGLGVSGPSKFIRFGRYNSFELIAEAKLSVDKLIVSMHWGHEHVHTPSLDVIKIGRRIIDSGADCIFGTHPHFVQGMETYKNRPIFYSLGNFVFTEPYEGSRWTVIVRLEIDDSYVKVLDLTPCRIGIDGIPDLVTSNDANIFIEKFHEYGKHIIDDGCSEQVLGVTKEVVKTAIRVGLYRKYLFFHELFPFGIGLKGWSKVLRLTFRDYISKLKR